MHRSDTTPRTDSPIQAFVQSLHERFAGIADGQVATYIPELAKVDPAQFGIVIATVMHPDAATRDRHEELGFFDGWNTCIDQLEAFASELG